MKPFYGSPKDVHQLLHMIKLPQHSLNEPTTFRQAVGWSSLGQNSQDLNPQQTSSISWVLFSLLKNLGRISYASTRHALYFALPSAMAAGTLGRTQLGSLWTPITTSITGPQITFVVNGAILLHWMVQILILSVWSKTWMVWLIIGVPSTHRLVFNSLTSLMSYIDCDTIPRHVNN